MSTATRSHCSIAGLHRHAARLAVDLRRAGRHRRRASRRAAGAGAPRAPAAAAPARRRRRRPAPAQAETPAPDGFRMGAFIFKPGGRVKLDVIRDFKPIGSEDSFDTRTIPVDGSEGHQLEHPRQGDPAQSRHPRAWRKSSELRMFIETDFYGTSSALRLRHAYGTLGRPARRSDVVHVHGRRQPAAHDRLRSADGVRADSPGAGAVDAESSAWLTWSAAVEDNKSAIVVPAGIPGKAEYPMPDLVDALPLRPARAAT